MRKIHLSLYLSTNSFYSDGVETEILVRDIASSLNSSFACWRPRLHPLALSGAIRRAQLGIAQKHKKQKRAKAVVQHLRIKDHWCITPKQKTLLKLRVLFRAETYDELKTLEYFRFSCDFICSHVMQMCV